MRRLLTTFALSFALAVGLAPSLALSLDGDSATEPTNDEVKLTTQMYPTDSTKD